MRGMPSSFELVLLSQGKREVLPPLSTAHLEPPLIFLSQEVTMKRFQILSPGSLYYGGFERGRA